MKVLPYFPFLSWFIISRFMEIDDFLLTKHRPKLVSEDQHIFQQSCTTYYKDETHGCHV